MKHLIETLQIWYFEQCNDSWEHSFGVEITTIDNPGWKIRITGATAKNPQTLECERSETDWIWLNGTATEFHAFGGPCNLHELLTRAVDWLQK